MLAHRLVGADNGPLIVFLHAVGITNWMWEPVVGRLPDHTCLLIDLPGHGQSNTVAWRSLEESARLVQETVETMGLQPAHESDVHLVGLSLGAYVAMILLSQKPAFYQSATLSGMHAGGMPNKSLMRAMSWVVAPFVVRPYFARKTAKMFGASEADTLTYVREARKTHIPSFRRATIDAVDFEMPDAAGTIQTMVTIAAGGEEHPLILETQPTIVGKLPHAQGYIADGVGHGWSYQDPQQFAALVDRQVRAEQVLKDA